jgi:hypothetical protein
LQHKAHCFVDNRGLYERAAREYATAPFAQFCASAEVRWCTWTSEVFVNVNDDGRIEHRHKSFEVAARSARFIPSSPRYRQRFKPMGRVGRDSGQSDQYRKNFGPSGGGSLKKDRKKANRPDQRMKNRWWADPKAYFCDEK